MSGVKAQQTPEIEQTAASTDRSSLSWKIFNAFLSKGQISVTENELREYAMEVLKLSEHKSKIPPDFMEHLPIVLVAFMNMWSGWHFQKEFSSGKIEKEQYHQRFQKFLTYKLNSLLKGQFATAMKEVQTSYECRQSKVEKKELEFAPYAISIECPPHMLNTITFSSVGDDIIMQQCVGRKCSNLSPLKLLNLPHVEVTFLNDDIHFVRQQVTEFKRYLTFLPHKFTKNPDYVVEHAESFGQQRCYSYDMLVRYINVYLLSLRSLAFSRVEFDEIVTILEQFLEDVKNIDVNKSIATNTVIRYRLSPAPFIRNQKLIKSGESSCEGRYVGYFESITPKVQLLLAYFRPKQIDDSVLRFEYTDKIKNAGRKNRAQFMPKISYKCTLCSVDFHGGDCTVQMVQHMQTKHIMEEHVRCALCTKQFEVVALAAAEWKHECKCIKKTYR